MNKEEASTNKAVQAAGEIASVLQATRHICQVWSSMPSETRSEIVQDWARWLSSHPHETVVYILNDLNERAEIRVAWDRLEAQEQASRVQIFAAILKKNGFE